jgi:hypothetical protein
MHHELHSAPFDDKYWSPASALHFMAEHLAAAIEIKSGLYSRRLPGPIRLNFVETIECLIVNFLSLHLTDPGRRLAVPLGKDDYRDSYVTYQALSKALEGLEMLGYVERFKGHWDKKTQSGAVTRFAATPRLQDEFVFWSLTPTMVRLRMRRPLIELRPSKQMRHELINSGRTVKERLPWPSEHRSDKARWESNLRKINAALGRQFTALHVADSVLAEVLRKQKRPVNLFQKNLHRVFTTDPNKGGRFVGAWWLTVPSELRQHIRMSAPDKPPDRTVELDYVALHLRMLYAVERVPCVEDPYLIYDDPAKSQACRKAVKLVSLMMINASSRVSAKKAAERKIVKKFRKRQGNGRPHTVGEMMALLWPGCPPLRELMADIQNKHAPIAKHFCTGAGRWLMFKDSEIAERIMLRMIQDFGVAPLPIHDSYIVRHDCADVLRKIMEVEYTAKLGAAIPVSAKPTKAPEDYRNERPPLDELSTHGLYHSMLAASLSA